MPYQKFESIREKQNKLNIQYSYQQSLLNLEIIKNKIVQEGSDINELYLVTKFILEQCFEGNLNEHNFEKITAFFNNEKPLKSITKDINRDIHE